MKSILMMHLSVAALGVEVSVSAEYYRGDPEACLAERKQKLAQAVEARKAYWAGVCRCSGTAKTLTLITG